MSLEKGNYYEAHQMYRTLYFRYTGQKKFQEALALLFEGSLKFLEFDQRPIAADLGILLVDTLEKAGDTIKDDYKKWIENLGLLIKNIGANVVERDTLIAKTVKWASTRQTTPEEFQFLVHQTIALALWDEGNLELAKHHFLLSRNGVDFGKMLIQFSAKGYSGEVDLFISHTVLQQLCLKRKETAVETFDTYTKYHPKIACTEPPFNLPLLNFVYFLLKAIDTGKLAMFKTLCDVYKSSIARDAAYEKYLQKIGVIYFGAPQQQDRIGAGGFLGDFINQLLEGMGNDDDNDDDNGSQGSDGDLD